MKYKLMTLWILLGLTSHVYAGVFNQRKVLINSVERKYVVKLPDNFTKNVKAPLIIALHGDGDSWKKFNKIITRKTLEKATNKHQAILVYPMAKNGYWDDDLDKQITVKRHDDVRFIENMIDFLIENHNVDKDKVFVVGMSNGGVMAIKLGIELNHKISGIAAVAAQMEFKAQYLQLKNPLSMILINGTEDEVFPYNGGQLKPFKLAKNSGKVLSTQHTLDYFIKNNNCQDENQVKHMDVDKMDMTTISTKAYMNCQKDKKVKLIKVIGGGHSWPGGKQYLPTGLIGRVSKEINASQVIADFFLNAAE